MTKTKTVKKTTSRKMPVAAPTPGLDLRFKKISNGYLATQDLPPDKNGAWREPKVTYMKELPPGLAGLVGLVKDKR